MLAHCGCRLLLGPYCTVICELSHDGDNNHGCTDDSVRSWHNKASLTLRLLYVAHVAAELGCIAGRIVLHLRGLVIRADQGYGQK